MLCIMTGPSQFCETLAKITLNGSVTFCEKFVVSGREF